ncbi:hypothetical protein SKZ59_08360 [Janthinobacterium sp. GMG2]|uniref:hypothetical protein n=1 Tax=Janthinobacterium TaxID=29580 RepID=UPI00044DD35C|nr:MULTISPECIES: hypothetical protein [Janthinobacterium]EZP36646.1 hypothetical protein BW37_04100 [Janthinobacterium lividum]MDX8121780.1 hypothetical protein [Janthinobacterium sp. GMG2]
MGWFSWKKKASVAAIGFEARIRSQSKQSKTLSYDLQGRQADAVRLQHPYLYHMTDVSTAEAIVKQQQLQGAFAYVTLSQGLQGALSQAERTGCVLVFRFHGQAIVGPAPLAKAKEVAYHHVGSDGYVETFIAHGTVTPLELIAISFRGTAPIYDVAWVLKTPVSVRIKP